MSKARSYASLKNEITLLKKWREADAARIVDLKRQVKNLKDECASDDKAIASLSDELVRFKRQALREAQRDLPPGQFACIIEDIEIGHTTGPVSTIEIINPASTIFNLRREVTKLKTNFERADGEVTKYRAELDVANTTIKSLTEINEKLSIRLTAFSFVSGYDDTKAAAEIERLTTENKKLTRTNLRPLAKDGEIESLRNRLVQANNELDKARSSGVRQTYQIETLGEELANAKIDILKLETANEALRKTISIQDAELTKVRASQVIQPGASAKLRREAQLEQTYLETREAWHRCQAECEGLIAANSNLRSTIKTYENEPDHLAEYKSLVEINHRTIQALQADRDELTEDITKLRKELHQAKMDGKNTGFPFFTAIQNTYPQFAGFATGLGDRKQEHIDELTKRVEGLSSENKTLAANWKRDGDYANAAREALGSIAVASFKFLHLQGKPLSRECQRMVNVFVDINRLADKQYCTRPAEMETSLEVEKSRATIESLRKEVKKVAAEKKNYEDRIIRIERIVIECQNPAFTQKQFEIAWSLIHDITHEPMTDTRYDKFDYATFMKAKFALKPQSEYTGWSSAAAFAAAVERSQARQFWYGSIPETIWGMPIVEYPKVPVPTKPKERCAFTFASSMSLLPPEVLAFRDKVFALHNVPTDDIEWDKGQIEMLFTAKGHKPE